MLRKVTACNNPQDEKRNIEEVGRIERERPKFKSSGFKTDGRVVINNLAKLCGGLTCVNWPYRRFNAEIVRAI